MALAPLGLCILGEVGEADAVLHLVGPDEPAFWPIFSASREYGDGQPDPMDRWSARVLTSIADDLGGEALFPFGGPPYAPFYSWATASGRAWPSPIGFLVHDMAGLFVSFRGAIRLRGTATSVSKESPCQTCTTKPCATACPVDAFADGYDVAACKAHVASAAGARCRLNGCLARRACPIGQTRRLAQQSAFHMEAFL